MPSYSRRHGGFLIAGAIDKYVYINIHPRFVDGFLLKYSHLEEVSSIDEIQHPIIRESLREVGIQARNLEITSMADIPAGTGLGSSGSFTTALLKALHAYKKSLIHPRSTSGTSLSRRDRHSERAYRQARSIYRGLRGHYLLRVRQRGWGESVAGGHVQKKRCSTWRTTCCCSLPATRARRPRF